MKHFLLLTTYRCLSRVTFQFSNTTSALRIWILQRFQETIIHLYRVSACPSTRINACCAGEGHDYCDLSLRKIIVVILQWGNWAPELKYKEQNANVTMPKPAHVLYAAPESSQLSPLLFAATLTSTWTIQPSGLLGTNVTFRNGTHTPQLLSTCERFPCTPAKF